MICEVILRRRVMSVAVTYAVIGCNRLTSTVVMYVLIGRNRFTLRVRNASRLAFSHTHAEYVTLVGERWLSLPLSTER